MEQWGYHGDIMGVIQFQQFDVWVWPENEGVTHHIWQSLRGKCRFKPWIRDGTLSSHTPIDWNSAEHQLPFLAGAPCCWGWTWRSNCRSSSIYFAWFSIAHFDAMENRRFSIRKSTSWKRGHFQWQLVRLGSFPFISPPGLLLRITWKYPWILLQKNPR